MLVIRNRLTDWLEVGRRGIYILRSEHTCTTERELFVHDKWVFWLDYVKRNS